MGRLGTIDADHLQIWDRDRLRAASDLTRAASAQDKRYQPLADATKDAAARIEYLDVDGVSAAVKKAKDFCGSL